MHLMKSQGTFLEQFVLLFSDLVMLNITHILQGYRSSEVLLNDMNK